MGRLNGRTAIVTGASTGIGKSIATRFAEEGAEVVMNSRSESRAEAAAAEIREDGYPAMGIAADVAEFDAVERMVEKTIDEFGVPDILVNNAAITDIKPAEEFDPDEWRHVIDVDLTGVFFCSQIVGKKMIESGTSGTILNISSMMGEMGFKMRSPYCAAKAGVNGLTKTLAVEWAVHDISVNALAPGFVKTDITEQTQESAGYTDDDVRKRTPMARYGTSEEIASCAVFLVEGDTFITGEILTADGGWTADAWRYWDYRGEH